MLTKRRLRRQLELVEALVCSLALVVRVVMLEQRRMRDLWAQCLLPDCLRVRGYWRIREPVPVGECFRVVHEHKVVAHALAAMREPPLGFLEHHEHDDAVHGCISNLKQLVVGEEGLTVNGPVCRLTVAYANRNAVHPWGVLDSVRT